MIEFLDTEDDVLAVKVAGKIVESDLDSIMNRLEPMLDSHDKVHVFGAGYSRSR